MSGGYYLEPALYDAVYADVVADVAPHVERVRSAGGPALEVCCGNGRLLLPVLAAGLRCDGLDRDERMLASLRAKLAAAGWQERADASGAVTRREEVRFSLRYVYKPELELLLRVAGFPRWRVRPAFGSCRDAGSTAGERPIREGDVLEWTAWRD